eukprot:365263-Chlamydomonas_euryale.AAC.1
MRARPPPLDDASGVDNALGIGGSALGGPVPRTQVLLRGDPRNRRRGVGSSSSSRGNRAGDGAAVSHALASASLQVALLQEAIRLTAPRADAEAAALALARGVTAMRERGLSDEAVQHALAMRINLGGGLGSGLSRVQEDANAGPGAGVAASAGPMLDVQLSGPPRESGSVGQPPPPPGHRDLNPVTQELLLDARSWLVMPRTGGAAPLSPPYVRRSPTPQMLRGSRLAALRPSGVVPSAAGELLPLLCGQRLRSCAPLAKASDPGGRQSISEVPIVLPEVVAPPLAPLAALPQPTGLFASLGLRREAAAAAALQLGPRSMPPPGLSVGLPLSLSTSPQGRSPASSAPGIPALRSRTHRPAPPRQSSSPALHGGSNAAHAQATPAPVCAPASPQRFPGDSATRQPSSPVRQQAVGKSPMATRCHVVAKASSVAGSMQPITQPELPQLSTWPAKVSGSAGVRAHSMQPGAGRGTTCAL